MIWVCTLFVYIILSEIYVYILSRPKLKIEEKIDILMVLGANGDIDSPVTRDRALNAAVAKEHFPMARFLLTGNESKGEVTAYKKLLSAHGYLEFVIETESTTTWENLKYSQELLKTLSSHEDRILLITCEYHQKRALAMARSLGLEADVFGKDPRKYKKALIYFIKERLSIYKYFPQMALANLFR